MGVDMKDRRRLRFLGESGAAAAEFALVCVPLVVILFGIVQFGAVLYVYNNMKNAAREGARWYAVGAPNADAFFGGNDAAAAAARAQDFLNPTWITATITTPPPVNNTGDPSVDCSNPADPDPDCDVTVTVTAPMGQAALIDLLDLMTSNGFQLVASTTMRREN
ncbi:MAG: TadE/TadG family type IV pilus assembly protein [Alphaproteobacteria bacterium]